MTEDQLQAKFFQTVWNNYPQTRCLLFSVPNGSSRHPLEAVKLKATGLISGIPDIIFVWKGKAYGIEIKTPIGKLSSRQMDIHKRWADNNIPIHIIRSVEEGISLIESIVLT